MTKPRSRAGSAGRSIVGEQNDNGTVTWQALVRGSTPDQVAANIERCSPPPTGPRRAGCWSGGRTAHVQRATSGSPARHVEADLQVGAVAGRAEHGRRRQLPGPAARGTVGPDDDHRPVRRRLGHGLHVRRATSADVTSAPSAATWCPSTAASPSNGGRGTRPAATTCSKGRRRSRHPRDHDHRLQGGRDPPRPGEHVHRGLRRRQRHQQPAAVDVVIAGTRTNRSTTNLSGGEQTSLVAGDTGWTWIPQNALDELQTFESRPFTYRNQATPLVIAPTDAIPGNAPALVDVLVTPSGGSATPGWGLIAWAKYRGRPAHHAAVHLRR
jgi:hypothetical protein